MKPRNATTAVNLIDLHLRRVLNIPAAYGQTALAAAGTVRLEYPGTIEKALAMRLFWAARRGDTVAETLAAPGRFAIVSALIAARDALVFATAKQGARVVFEVEPHALQYRIKVGDQATTYPLGLFKIVGGKRAGKRYSIEVE